MEVHLLHALGEHELVDGTCGRDGDERENEKVRNEETRAAEPHKISRVHASSCVLSFLDTAEDVPITWFALHPMWISLVSKEGATYLRTVVCSTNVSLPQFLSCTRAVEFAGHSMAATSIFTSVFLISKVFILGGSNVTRVPEMRK